MKSVVWRPGWTGRHLLWATKFSSSQCAVTPIYEQLLDAVCISFVLVCVEACWSEVLSGLLTDVFESHPRYTNAGDGLKNLALLEFTIVFSLMQSTAIDRG